MLLPLPTLHAAEEDTSSLVNVDSWGVVDLSNHFQTQVLKKDDPFTLPWNNEPESFDIRRQIYRDIIRVATKEECVVEVDGRHPWYSIVYWEGWPRIPSPLASLRVQQPHLIEEIDRTFHSTCRFKFGSKDTSTSSFEIGSRWLRYIGERQVSHIKYLEFWVTSGQIQKDPFELVGLLELLANSPPRRDLAVVDFELCALRNGNSTKDSTDPDKSASSPVEYRFILSGLFSVQIWLQIQCEHKLGLNDAAKLTESCFELIGSERPLNRPPLPHTSFRSKILYARQGRRVNLFQKLPPEILFKIFANLCVGADWSHCVWSPSLHCPRSYLVCQRFVQESKRAWCHYSLLLNLRSCFWTETHNVVNKIGGEMLSQMMDLSFKASLAYEDVETDWRCQLLWLVKTLCHFSLESHSTRNVCSLTLVDAYYVDPSEFGERRGNALEYFAFEAEFYVTLENESVPPFTLLLVLQQDPKEGRSYEDAARIFSNRDVEANMLDAVERTFKGEKLQHEKYVWAKITI